MILPGIYQVHHYYFVFLNDNTVLIGLMCLVYWFKTGNKTSLCVIPIEFISACCMYLQGRGGSSERPPATR